MLPACFLIWVPAEDAFHSWVHLSILVKATRTILKLRLSTQVIIICGMFIINPTITSFITHLKMYIVIKTYRFYGKISIVLNIFKRFP